MSATHEYGEERHTRIAPLTGTARKGEYLILGGGFPVNDTTTHGELKFYIKAAGANAIMAEISVLLNKGTAFCFPIAVHAREEETGVIFPNAIFDKIGIAKDLNEGWILAGKLFRDFDGVIDVTIRSTDFDLNLMRNFETHASVGWGPGVIEKWGIVDAKENYPSAKVAPVSNITGDIVSTSNIAPNTAATYEGQRWYGYDAKSGAYYNSHIADAALVWKEVRPSSKSTPRYGEIMQSNVRLTTSEYAVMLSRGEVVPDTIYLLT